MRVEYRRSDLSIDQQVGLRTAASHLAREFDDPAGLYPDAPRAADAVVVPHGTRAAPITERITR